jgi:hypothetical protein
MAESPKTEEKDWPSPWMPVFLRALRNSANVRAACQAAGLTRAGAYKARGQSVRFSKAWDEALDDAIDTLEATAWQRARAGSDFILWRLLASLRREKYGDAIAVKVDLTAEAERIARERGLPPEQAGKIVEMAEHLKRGRAV